MLCKANVNGRTGRCYAFLQNYWCQLKNKHFMMGAGAYVALPDMEKSGKVLEELGCS